MTRLWQADLVLKLASSLKIFRKEYWILPLLSQYPNWVIFFSNEQRTFTNHLLFFQKNWIPRNAMIMSSGIFLSEVPVLFYNLWYNGLVPESVLSQIRASELKHRQRKRAQRMSRYVQEWREKFITCTHTRTHMYNYPFMKNLFRTYFSLIPIRPLLYLSISKTNGFISHTNYPKTITLSLLSGLQHKLLVPWSFRTG